MKKRETAEHSKNSLSSTLVEVNMKLPKQEPKYFKHYVTREQRQELISTLGDAACMLFEYYLRVGSIKEPTEILDQNAADYFPWNIQKVQRNRLKLEKAGFFYHRNFYSNTGIKAVTYYLGKDIVKGAKP